MTDRSEGGIRTLGLQSSPQLRATAGDEQDDGLLGFLPSSCAADFTTTTIGGGSREKRNKAASVRLLIRLDGSPTPVALTDSFAQFLLIINQLPADDVPPDGVKEWAKSPVQKVALVGAELCGTQASGRGAMPPHVISLLHPLPHPTREAGRRPRAAVGFSQHASGLPKYDALNRPCRMVWFEEELHRPLSRMPTAPGTRSGAAHTAPALTAKTAPTTNPNSVFIFIVFSFA